MDIAIVLDGSNSIYPWPPVVSFLKKLLESLVIGPQQSQACKEHARLNITGGIWWQNDLLFYRYLYNFMSEQVSVIQYGVDPKMEFMLNTYKTTDSLIQAASKIPQRGGTETNTFRAIEYTRYVWSYWSCLCTCKLESYFRVCVCVTGWTLFCLQTGDVRVPVKWWWWWLTESHMITLRETKSFQHVRKTASLASALLWVRHQTRCLGAVFSHWLVQKFLWALTAS